MLDLVQLHCVPADVLWAGDLLSWLDEFRDAGLIREFGASVETIDEALFAVEHPTLTSIQIIFNLVRQDPIGVVLPAAASNGVGVIVRLPLASGVLSGKMTTSQQFAASDHRSYNRDGASFNVGETFSGLPFERAVNYRRPPRDADAGGHDDGADGAALDSRPAGGDHGDRWRHPP